MGAEGGWLFPVRRAVLFLGEADWVALCWLRQEIKAASPEIVFGNNYQGYFPRRGRLFPAEGGAISRRSRLRLFLLAAPRNRAASPEIVFGK